MEPESKIHSVVIILLQQFSNGKLDSIGQKRESGSCHVLSYAPGTSNLFKLSVLMYHFRTDD